MAHTLASSSTAASPNNSYHVFINHRGPDVKKTFASHLYHRLFSAHGLRVFLDQKELQAGDDLPSQIKNAITNSSVHVAIFSPRYAESAWCLNELLHMLESATPIIPVFYHIEPAELRWSHGKGVYAEAIHKLEEKKTHNPQTNEEEPRHDPATIQRWREALSRVSDISGLDLHGACNGDEGELVERIVQRVLEKVKKPGLHVAKYPIGLNEKVEDFENKVLKEQSGKARVVGIVGMGGAGKTTLAKELFNRKSSKYGKAYFLHDVREGKSSLQSLQRKLLKGLTHLNRPIDSVDHGVEMLKECLSTSHSKLIILDDVDDRVQVDALLPDLKSVCSNTFILITSRDKDVLTKSGVEQSSIYYLTGLNPQHARELLCLHAFSLSYPPPEFAYLVKKFVTACDGLPLSLEVFGAHLYGENGISYWEDQLGRLQNILPNEIQETLKISYDALHREDKQIFLDIACFFIGENKDMAIRIWDGSGWKGSLGFRNLQNRCLVKLDNENVIGMHDHIRDLGREIAERSRLSFPLWHATENIDDLLQQSNVIAEVRGIKMGPREYKDDNGYTSFSCYKMRKLQLWNLQLLDIEDCLLERVLRKGQAPNLVWLRWYNCPYSSLPSWIPMKKLRVLEVHGNELQTLWQSESQTPLHLRELKIMDAPLSKFPKSIGKLKHLERICVNSRKENINVKALPDEFCNLGSLITLELISFSLLKTLPDSFGNLASLQHLNLHYCSNLESLPISFGNLTNLHRIDLSGCSNLERIPNSFGYLTNLLHIDLSRCSKLESLPNSFGNLIQLRYLSLHGCSNLNICREALGNISKLEYINLSSCLKIQEVPPQIARQRSLKELYLERTNLKELPNAIGDLINLEVLKLRSPLLETLPASLGDLRNLKRLSLWECRKLQCLPDSVRLLSQLIELKVINCPLRELPFKKCEVETETSNNLKSSNDNCMLLRLQRLFLHGTEISDISFEEDLCPTVQHLNIQFCGYLDAVGTLPNALIELTLDHCSLRKIEGLRHLAKLQKLYISYCIGVEELAIETLISLKELTIIGQMKLKIVKGLAELKKLQNLNVRECFYLKRLEGVEHCLLLEELNIYVCPRLQWDGEVVEQLCKRLKNFVPFSNERILF